MVGGMTASTIHVLILVPGFHGVDHGSSAVPLAVTSYITAAYGFTASTSFANPAVTIARSLTDTFSGIRPVDGPLSVVAQLTGGLAATFSLRWLIPALPSSAEDVVLPQCARREKNATV
jgi:glycerol uptake facilitator-like aquaporin